MSPRALLSVYDKAGIVDLARGLVDLGWEIVSSGGTASLLAGEGVPVTEVAGEDIVIALQASWIPVDGYRGVIAEDILPSTVHVHLDHMATASAPVRVKTRGSLPEQQAL